MKHHMTSILSCPQSSFWSAREGAFLRRCHGNSGRTVCFLTVTTRYHRKALQGWLQSGCMLAGGHSAPHFTSWWCLGLDCDSCWGGGERENTTRVNYSSAPATCTSVKKNLTATTEKERVLLCCYWFWVFLRQHQPPEWKHPTEWVRWRISESLTTERSWITERDVMNDFHPCVCSSHLHLSK